jgi:hypothetical protein
VWGVELLFRYLHDDAFLAFSREHKHLYAACLLELYDRYFNGAPAFPTPQEVTHSVYDTMRTNPSRADANHGPQLRINIPILRTSELWRMLPSTCRFACPCRKFNRAGS